MDFMKKYRRGSAKFIFWSEKQAIKRKITNFKRKLDFARENNSFRQKLTILKRKIVVLSEKSWL